MDTTEQLGGSYFYKGYSNLTPLELFYLIWLDATSQHLDIEIIAALMIVSGQPMLPTRTKPGTATPGTSLSSIVFRRMLPDVRLPRGIRIPSLVGKTFIQLHVSMTNSLNAGVARNVPWIGYALAGYAVARIARDTRGTYNRIVKPEHRIAWIYF